MVQSETQDATEAEQDREEKPPAQPTLNDDGAEYRVRVRRPEKDDWVERCATGAEAISRARLWHGPGGQTCVIESRPVGDWSPLFLGHYGR